jgi:pyruvate dehydrogenase E2 component (dihydrolipoamide acetyltransferase)
MATQVPIPKLGQSEETVSIVKWHKSEGDTIAKGDVLFEVETDKAVLEVESQFEGTLLKIVIPEGKEVPVMSIAAVLGEPGEAIPAIQQPAPPAKEEKPAAVPPAPKTAPAAAPAEPSAIAPTPAAVQAAPAPAPAATPAPPKKRAVSPRARRFAADFLIHLDRVQGSGPNGRVVERDVRAYLDSSGYNDRKITPAAANLARKLNLALLDITATGSTGRVTVEDVQRTDAERPKPMSKMRQVIAKRMQESKKNIPHFCVTVSVDMTDLMAYRKALKKADYQVGVNDFVLKASALALQDFPVVNSCTEDGLNVRWHSSINVGMAVSVDNGLVVPVLRKADEMSLDELHAAARELADKARDGKLLPDDMKGGTFTVSNMGMLNVEHFTAIINPGESAILAVGSVIPSVVATPAREMVVRDIMKITLSADHRIIDGAVAAQFVNAVKRRLEDISLWESLTGISPA